MHYCDHCGRRVLVKHPKLGLGESSDESGDDDEESGGSGDSIETDDMSD